MSFLRTCAKAVLPVRARQALRAAHRKLVFRRAMRRFLADPAACAHAGSPILRDLVYGWGNAGYSAADEYLARCLELALAGRGPILECGSGLTTLLVGAIAQRHNQPHWALEHTAEWATRVQAAITTYRLHTVTECVVPLKDFGDFTWYDVPLAQLPERFALVVCDGPPAETKGGRYGLAPRLKSRLAPGCVILLDDASREAERAIAQRWAVELGATVQARGTDKPYLELTLGAASPAPPLPSPP